MKQRLLMIILLFAMPILVSAQYDSIANEFKKEFEQFKKTAIQKQTDFINKNDSIFIEFLKQSWETVRLVKSQAKEEPKPVIQPFSTERIIRYELKLIKTKETPSLKKEHKGKLETTKLSPVKYNSRFVINKLDFYGTNEEVLYSPQLKPKLYKVSVDNIIEFYSNLSLNGRFWDYTLNQLIAAKAKYLLNDWGYYQLVQSTAKGIFEKENERQLFCWYLLLKSGYDVRVGYNSDEVFLLIPSIHELYNVPYLKDSGNSYYILDKYGKQVDNIRTYKTVYPGSNRTFSFNLSDYPNFKGELSERLIDYKGEKVLFHFEEKVLDFLNSYPQCELKAYFNNKISEGIFKKLDHLFSPLIKGKNNREIVDELLHFCQVALEYKTDKEQFGKERYLFAEESLFYPFSDCEDRTILLATLIHRYTGLSTIALDFPGHVALAVNLQNIEEGAFVTYNKKKYLVCDPTYINAKSGMIPDNLKTQEVEIIEF